MAFRPEFLNRIDQIVVFHELDRTELRQIVDLLLAKVAARLSEQEITLQFGDDLRDFLMREGYDQSSVRDRCAGRSRRTSTTCWRMPSWRASYSRARPRRDRRGRRGEGDASGRGAHPAAAEQMRAVYFLIL